MIKVIVITGENDQPEEEHDVIEARQLISVGPVEQTYLDGVRRYFRLMLVFLVLVPFKVIFNDQDNLSALQRRYMIWPPLAVNSVRYLYFCFRHPIEHKRMNAYMNAHSKFWCFRALVEKKCNSYKIIANAFSLTNSCKICLDLAKFLQKTHHSCKMFCKSCIQFSVWTNVVLNVFVIAQNVTDSFLSFVFSPTTMEEEFSSRFKTKRFASVQTTIRMMLS